MLNVVLSSVAGGRPPSKFVIRKFFQVMNYRRRYTNVAVYVEDTYLLGGKYTLIQYINNKTCVELIRAVYLGSGLENGSKRSFIGL